jgi:hypothetical protein
MTYHNLSPQAQAVLDAFESTKFADHYAIAAALRAAANQLAYEDAEGRKFIYVPELLAIAAELEGQ